MVTPVRGGFQRRAHAVVSDGELRNYEEGGQRVANKPAPGAEVVVANLGRMSTPE
jgi:hypothetical protein